MTYLLCVFACSPFVHVKVVLYLQALRMYAGCVAQMRDSKLSLLVKRSVCSLRNLLFGCDSSTSFRHQQHERMPSRRSCFAVRFKSFSQCASKLTFESSLNGVRRSVRRLIRFRLLRLLRLLLFMIRGIIRRVHLLTIRLRVRFLNMILILLY